MRNVFRWRVLLVLHLAASIHAGTSWPQFRGPNGAGVAPNATPPLRFDRSTNLLWSTPVPLGHSSPIAWEGRIFLTAIEGGKLLTLCLDRQTGKELWRRVAAASELEKTHEFSNPAASTPVTDGERVYVYFGSCGLLAYDFAGEQAWTHPLPMLPNRYGTATSPFVAGGRVILQRDGDSSDSEVLALDVKTGQTAWSTKRPGFSSAWSTPMIWTHDQQTELILNGTPAVVAYDFQTGKERWRVPGSSFAPQTVAVAGDGLLFVHSSGTGDPADRPKSLSWKEFAAQHASDPAQPMDLKKIPDSEALHLRPEVSKDMPGNYPKMRDMLTWFADENHDGLLSKEEYDGFVRVGNENANKVMAIRHSGGQSANAAQIAWTATRGVSELPSPLFYEGRLWFVRNGGMVSSFEPKSGRLIINRERLGPAGQYVASPVGANGCIYAVSEGGVFTVFRPSDRLEVIATNELHERVLATPALVDSTLIVRTTENVYAFGSRP